jgi:hypothetical protein
VAILLMGIDGYSINGYRLFLLLMVIDGYSINGYFINAYFRI